MSAAAGAPADEDAYVREASAQRAHDLELARVNASTETELARINARTAEERRGWWGAVLAGVAVVAVIGTIIGAIVWNVNRDREQTGRDRARQAQVAETCIHEGNIWLNGNCIPARKG